MPVDAAPTLYLPLSVCESLDTSGASSVASVSTVSTPSGREIVVVGSTDGHIYVVSGTCSSQRVAASETPGAVVWRVLATARPSASAASETDRQNLLEHGEWDCPAHHRIQSVVAVTSSCGLPVGATSPGTSPQPSLGGSIRSAVLRTPPKEKPHHDDNMPDYLLIVVLSVQRAAKTSMVHVYMVPDINAVLDPPVASDNVNLERHHLFPAVEWRRMLIPGPQQPLRMFLDRSFGQPVGLEGGGAATAMDGCDADAHHIIISAMELDPATPHILHAALGVITLPFSGLHGSTPPGLQWVSPAASSSENAAGSFQRLSWVVARSLLRATSSPISALCLLMFDTNVFVAVAGCVDGRVVVVQLDASTSPSEGNLLSLVRCAGPVADCLAFQARVQLTFPVPNAVLDELESSRFGSKCYEEDRQMRRVLVLDSSGKVLMLVIKNLFATAQIVVDASKLPDYAFNVDAKLAPEFVASVLHGKGKGGPPNASTAPARRTPGFPDIALGIQNRLSAVSKFFRSYQSKLLTRPEVSEVQPHPTAGKIGMSQSPQMSSSFVEFLVSSASTKGDETTGALLAAGPIAIAQCDVNGDGLYELVITTMGRFVALYRFLPESGTFVCMEVAEAPTHLFFCKQVRLWSHTAVPAWVMCGPNHILVHCGPTLRDIVASRAFLLERCLVGESLLET